MLGYNVIYCNVGITDITENTIKLLATYCCENLAYLKAPLLI